MSGIQLRRRNFPLPFVEGFGDLMNWAGLTESALPRSRGLWFPIDVVETEDDFIVTAEVSGVRMDDIDVNLDRNVLTVKTTKSAAEEVEGLSYHIRERETGEFARAITLPESIDPGRVSASHTDGVLEIRLPKAEESKPRRIDVRSA